MSANTTLFAFVLSFLSACAYTDDGTQRLDPEENPSMARVVTPITPIIKPNSLVPGDVDANVFPPEPGSTTLANDIGPSLQTIQDQVFTLVDVKVNRAGDTMTGKLTINNATSNQEALEVTGNGTGAGLIANGGATGYGALFNGGLNKYGLISTGGGTGAGVRGVGDAGGDARGGEFAASGNGDGVHATGHGTGAGVECIGGASAPGLMAASGTAGTTTAPQEGIRSTGFIRVFGAQPNSNVDPGEDNVIHGTNLIKAWATLNSSYVVQDGYNIASVALDTGAIYEVTFVRPMANNKYGVKISVNGAPGYSGAHNGTKSTTGFKFVLYKTDAPGTLGFGSATEAYIEIVGRQ